MTGVTAITDITGTTGIPAMNLAHFVVFVGTGWELFSGLRVVLSVMTVCIYVPFFISDS
jgi:hypothetical protein